MMIYIRPRLIKWGILSPSLGFSTSRVPTENTGNNQNPFKNKSYAEINRIMSLGISQKNELTFCNYILKTSLERISEQSQHQKMSSDRAIKQQLINKVLDKVMSNYLTKLTPGDIYRIIVLESLIIDNRSFKLSESNRAKFRNELLGQLKVLIEKDKNGDQVNVYKLILFELVKSKKRIKIVKDIIQHLKKHSLRSNSDLIQFLNRFSNLDHGSLYDDDIVELLQRYVNSEKNTMSNTREWVNPKIMELLIYHSDSLTIPPNSLIRKFIEGLQIEFKQGKISINQKLTYFKHLINWIEFANPYYLISSSVSRIVNLTYSLFKQVTVIIQPNTKIQSNSLEIIFQCSTKFKNFASVAHKILGKSENQLLAELNNFAHKAFQHEFLNQFENLKFAEIVSMLNVGLELPRQQQIRLVRSIIKMLNDKKQQNSLISRMRLFEYAAKSIYQGKSVDKSQIQPLLRGIEKKSKQLKEYQILRICNIFRLLGLQSKQLDDYFKYKIQKNEIFAIQNMSRTMLKQYSYDLIIKSLESLKSKYINNEKNSSSQLSQALWYAFKSSNNTKSEQNLDPIFAYWFVNNLSIFKEITKKFENSRIIMANSIKELNVKVKGIQSQISLQLLIQVLHSWATQNQAIKSDQYSKFYIPNLKQLLQSRHIIQIGLVNNFRHSLPIKILQSYYSLSNFQKLPEQYYKRVAEILQIIYTMKKEGPIHFSERPSIRFLLLARNVRRIDINQQCKFKNIKHVIDLWFFSNYYRDQIQFNYQIFEKKLWLKDTVTSTINDYLGPLFLAQWKFANKKIGFMNSQQQLNSMFKDTTLPVQIYTGTLTKQSNVNYNGILDSLVFPKTMEFMIHKFPHISDAYVEQIMKIPNSMFPSKLIQASNMVYAIKEMVSLSVRNRFRQWLKQTLVREYPVDKNPSIIQLYLKLNLIPTSPQVLAKYISEQLANLNFSIVSNLYTTGYLLTQTKQISTDISTKFTKFIKRCCGNHWLQYLVDLGHELLTITTSFFGLSLQIPEKKIKLQAIKQCIYQMIEREGQKQAIIISINKMIKSTRNDKKSSAFQIYMILKLVSIQVDESIKQGKVIKSMLNDILTENPNIEAQLLSFYSQESRLQLFKFYPSDTKYATNSSQFPQYKGKSVWLHKSQPGVAWIIDQYLSKCVKDNTVSTFDVFQIQGLQPKQQVIHQTEETKKDSQKSATTKNSDNQADSQ